jgi:serine/threonine-protein kinase HipA
LRAEAYGDFPDHLMRLPGFIVDSLPDGWGMVLMDRLFQQKGYDLRQISPLDRLSFIGHRAVGALVFEPEIKETLYPEAVQLAALAEESQLVLADVDTPALRQLALMGGSPQGARPKVLVHWDRVTGLMSTTPTQSSLPWLVKFQARQEHKEVCAIEELYATLARDCGLDMPPTCYFDLSPELAGFGIQRFDVDAGMRVPTLTLAGLMHANFRLPQVDYLTFLRATGFLTKDKREVAKAFERAVFNVVFHNRDDHTKNFSFRLNKARQWQLSPCYDLTFNLGPGGEHSMAVQGFGKEIKRAPLLELAQKAGLNVVLSGQVIDRMREVADNFEEYAKRLPIRAVTVSELSKYITTNQRLLG